MPGPAIHYLISQKVPDDILERLGGPYEHVSNAMAGDIPYTSFGSVGPDFLFFHLKDLHPALNEFVKVYYDVAEFIEEFRQKIVDLVPDELIELAQTIENLQNQVAQRSVYLTELREGLLDAKQVLDGLLTLVREATTKHITDSVDLFGILKHPIQDGQSANIWWWFDTLHYRRTGKFAKYLLDNSAKGTPNHSYAIGYLSHIAADVVGHPYVNLITGGPFRTHPQRHKFVENFQDTWAFNHYKKTELVYSQLYKDFDFGLSTNRLPNSLKKFISSAITDVYGRDFGKKITPDEVENAYRLWFTWFKNSTGSGTIPRPKPYSLTGEFQQAWETFTNNASDAVGLVGDANRAAGGGILGILAALAAAILAAILLAVSIIDFLLGSLTTIGMAPVRVFLSIMYQSIYDAFLNYRLAVSLNGFAFPFVSHLNRANVMHATNPSFPDSVGSTANSIFNSYPRQKVNTSFSEKHLFYPSSFRSNRLESIATIPSPNIYLNNQPNIFIDGRLNFGNHVLPYIQGMTDNNNDLRRLHKMMRKDELGNAVRLTTEFYRIMVDQKKIIPDFNLDGDRGMGYKTWRTGADDMTSPPVTNPNNINFI